MAQECDARINLRQEIADAAAGAIIHAEIIMRYCELGHDADTGYAARHLTECVRRIGQMVLVLEAKNDAGTKALADKLIQSEMQKEKPR